MKIRLDFITNSSSSSYIIAKHKDCTFEDIMNFITNSNNIQALQQLLGENFCCNCEEENKCENCPLYKNDYSNVDYSNIDFQRIAEILFERDGVKIGDYIVSSDIFDPDYDEEYFVYRGLYLQSDDKIIIK